MSLGSDSQALNAYYQRVVDICAANAQVANICDTADAVSKVCKRIDFTADPSVTASVVGAFLLQHIKQERMQLYTTHPQAYRALIIHEGRITHDDPTPSFSKFG